MILISILYGCSEGERNQTTSSAELIASFQLAEGFQIELIASEPLIADPVAMEIDESGQMYVVQMHGYPLDKGGSGSIKLLSDTDGDGVMDRSVTFADGLVLPNGIMRWKNGILVTDAPNLLYFEDSDGDGKADLRDTLLTGFALSNPQHKVSLPYYGLDNSIYLANEPITAAKIYVEEFGDTGQEIRYPHLPNASVLPQNANGRRVRLRPDRGELEMLSAATQFSNAQDPWGRYFLGNNTNHIYHEVIQAKYLARNPFLEVSSATQTISSYGMPADVYPITENPEHQIFTAIGVFTSACGVTWYNGGLFPASFDQVAFIAEPVSNIVHATKLQQDGASFKASRLYEKDEFLASKDPWFRPVNHYIGPDGALYIIDYHRRYIEHPEWMGEDVANSGALYEGKDKGRIYRITPKGTPIANWSDNLDLDVIADGELLAYLRHPNGWYRRTAQRLLVDRQSNSVVAELTAMALSDSVAYGRLHAAWTLEGLNSLSREVVIGLLRDAVDEVRENGILLAEQLLPEDPGLVEYLLDLQQDENVRVRFQLLCTLGGMEDDPIRAAREHLLFSAIDNPWIQVAALSARVPDYRSLLERTVRHFSGKEAGFIERLAGMDAAQNGASRINYLLNLALSTDEHDGAWQSAILSGLSKRKRSVDLSGNDFDRQRSNLLDAVFNHPHQKVRTAGLEMLKLIGLPKGTQSQEAINCAVNKARDSQAPVEERQHALKFLSIGNPMANRSLFYELLSTGQPLDIQKESLKTLGEHDGANIAEHIRQQWPTLSPQIRSVGITVLLNGREQILIRALEDGVIDASSVSFYQQIYLMTLEDEDLRRRSRLVFSDESKDEQRKKVIAEYKQSLEIEGDVVHGKVIFEKNCSVCHQLGAELGTAYGPDLGTIRNRRPESILTDILDPGLSIADGFDLWDIRLVNGESRQGIIASETPTTIALSIYGASDEVFSRQDIQSMRALGMTIMPAGLEETITKEDMADLLAFLKKPE